MTFAIANIYAGQISDKVDRSKLLGIAVMLWSLTTIFSGMTTSFTLLFVMRMSLGLL